MAGGFGISADAHSSLAGELNSLSQRMVSSLPQEGFQGKFADAAIAAVQQFSSSTGRLADASYELAAASRTQADADAKLAAAPSPKEVAAAVAAYQQAAANRSPDLASLYSERQALGNERKAALAAHGSSSGASAASMAAVDVPCAPSPGGICVPGGGGKPTEGDDSAGNDGSLDAPSDETPADSAPMPGDAPSTSAAPSDMSDGGGTTPSVSDSAAGTSLTADSGAGTPLSAQPALAQQAPAQPQMAPMAGQPQGGAGGGGVPGGGAAPAGTGIPRGSMLGAPSGGSRGGSGRNRDKKEGITPSALDGLFGVGAPAAAAAVVGGIDRGSSVSGVTTERTVTGPGATQGTALSGAGGANPNNPSNPNQGAMRGGMGGMPMGGMGAGAGMGSGNTVARPDIKAATETLVQQQDRESVQGGVVGRDTASDPTKDEEPKR